MTLAEFDAQANQLARETAGQSVTLEDQDTPDRPAQGTTAPPVTFFATLAGANTSARWLSVGHDGDAKITLEAPASELPQVLKLALLSGQALAIHVTPLPA